MITAGEYRDFFLVASRGFFEADGELDPVVVLVNNMGDGLALVPLPGGNPRDTLPPLVAMGAAFMPVAFIVTAVETWMKQFPSSERHNLQPGDLEWAESEGDPDVSTALMVVVIDVKAGSPPSGASAYARVIRRDDGTIEWDDNLADGPIYGSVAERLLQASRVGAQAAPVAFANYQHYDDLPWVAAQLKASALVHDAMVFPHAAH